MLPRVAALIVLAMALVLWVDVLFRARLVGVIGSSGYSTTAGLVISAVTLPVAVGLVAALRLGLVGWPDRGGLAVDVPSAHTSS